MPHYFIVIEKKQTRRRNPESKRAVAKCQQNRLKCENVRNRCTPRLFALWVFRSYFSLTMFPDNL